MRAPSGAEVLPAGFRPTKPRHMDTYPSRNAAIREHGMTASPDQSNACGDRLRSAGAFLD
jgi:hypothetical protein